MPVQSRLKRVSGAAAVRGGGRDISGVGTGGARPPVPNATAFWPMDVVLPTITDRSGRGNDLSPYMKPAVSDVAFVIGANTTGGQALTGSVAKWGNWKRVLTAGEKAALRAGEGWPFNTTPSLRDATVFYLLDEASNAATYADATGRGNTLTRTGATTKVAGPLGSDFAVNMAGASRLVLNPPTADVQNGNVAQTISGWCYLDAIGAGQQIFYGQLEFATIKFSNCLYYFGGVDRLQSDFGNNVDLYRNPVIVSNAAGAPGTGVWHHMLFTYDPATNVETLEIDGVANTLSPVQQPARLTTPNRAHFAIPPSFSGIPGATSGWDAVGSACHATHAHTTDLAIQGASRSAWGWVKFSDFTTTQTIMGRTQTVGGSANCDWWVQQAAGLLYFVMGDGVGNIQYFTVPLADTNWHAFICWYNAGTGFMHINLDNGAQVNSVLRTVGVSSAALPFNMGANDQNLAAGGYSQQLLADIGVAGVSTGVPSAADIAALYAYGAGKFY